MRNVAEIIHYILVVSGEEILTGRRRDSHVFFITNRLASLGFHCLESHVIGDKQKQLSDLIRKALERVPIVITTGGLGPTLDDLTRESISAAMDIPLHEHPDALKMVEDRFRSFRKHMADNNRRQALVPESGGFFYNPNGTAPGLFFEKDDHSVIALPGPPRELEPMFDDRVIPYLEKRYSIRRETVSRSFLFCCLGESDIDSIVRRTVGNDDLVEVSSISQPGSVDLTLSINSDRQEALDVLERSTHTIRQKLGHFIYSERDETLPQTVGRLLIEKKQTVAVAESCTGGLLGSQLTSVPGSSAYFLGGIIAYQNAVKHSFLGVKQETLDTFGAVSRETVREMAQGVCERFGSDWGIAITGIAGPDGGTEEKPVGTVWIAVHQSQNKTTSLLITFPGTRDAIRLRSTMYSLDQLRRILVGYPPHQ